MEQLDEGDFMTGDMETDLQATLDADSPRALGATCAIIEDPNPVLRRSYKNMFQQNNPHLNFSARVHPVWEHAPYYEVSDGDKAPEEDDLTYPTISY